MLVLIAVVGPWLNLDLGSTESTWTSWPGADWHFKPWSISTMAYPSSIWSWPIGIWFNPNYSCLISLQRLIDWDYAQFGSKYLMRFIYASSNHIHETFLKSFIQKINQNHAIKEEINNPLHDYSDLSPLTLFATHMEGENHFPRIKKTKVDPTSLH